MGSSNATPAPSAHFLRRFAAAAGDDGVLSFADFMRLALYDPEVGYYRRQRARVGYGRGTDFFTATTSGPIFGELVAAAATRLLGEAAARDHAFIEIGAEPAGGIMAGVDHAFREVRSLPLGAALEISGPAVVFSNELFDAQPCRRFVRRGDAWCELGVAGDGATLREVDLGPAQAADYLPAEAPDGYRLDAPEAAVSLIESIAVQPWHGLFLAFDYGKTWTALANDTPAGTARAYFQHTQSNDLLARPGDQDLTCHVCWDWLEAGLRRHGFASPQVESQEAFFVHHAAEFMARTIAAEAHQASRRKLALMQLLHPAHLGQKFQVLHARRGPGKLH